MAISPYLARLRERIGTDLVLMPTVAVLPRDPDGRLLLVRHTDSGRWATIGGMVEPDESPQEAARREAREEAGVDVRLDGIAAVLGGPGYRVTYPSGDEVACVPIVFDASVVGGRPRPDHDETSEVAWFAPVDLATLELTSLNRSLLAAVGLC